jgi:hypothetical protein
VVKSTNPVGDCYCHLWEKDPDHMRSEGIPEGYCGFCSILVKGKECGKPGHIRQGNGPYTVCSCDDHASEPGFNPITVGCNLLILLSILAAAWMILRWIF